MGSIHDSLLPRFDFGSIFAHLFQGTLSELLYCNIRIQNSLCVFDWRAKTIVVCAPFCVAWWKCCPSTTSWEFPNKVNHVRHALCWVLKHGDEPSDCESSCRCHYFQIEGLGLHVAYITRYVIRTKKHLRNRIEIIEMESNRKEYESLHPCCKGIVSGTISRLLHGIPESETHESASKTASLCINIFKAAWIEISNQDIAITHRIPTRIATSGPRLIVCKFTRRIVKEQVMNTRNEACKVSATSIGLPSSYSLKNVRVFDNLTPMLQ